jgi:Tfp pilus assembly protein PilV
MYFQAGSSFIEIIISMFLISLMLLGLDAMHIMALREAKSSYYFSVAMQQLLNMSERLHSSDENDLTEQIAEWNKQNTVVLPDGRGVVSGRYPGIRVEVFWGDNKQHMCRANKIGLTGCVYLVG